MENAFGAEIHYSPSLEVENIENKNGLSLSIVTKTEWYVFFKRPKTVKVKKFFGLKNIDKFDENYVTHLTGQNKNFARECIQALLTNDLSFLEENIR